MTVCPSSGQNSPNNFALLQHSVKHDMHQVILAVLQLPLFAQAIIGFCRVVVGIPDFQADHAQYLGTMQLLKHQTQDQDVDMLANLKPGSKAVLLLLGQVDAALKAIQLADDGALLPHTNL
ncbi:hypothetical protein C0989_008554 [Termitomyces sp. Mn162]|nr:hypothetical protein C0989_008554 [Termitomyces sp. Mn162]